MSAALYCWGLVAEVPTCRRQPTYEVTRTRLTADGGSVLTQATLPYCPSCLHEMNHDPNVIVHHVEPVWGVSVSDDRRKSRRPEAPGRRRGDGV